MVLYNNDIKREQLLLLGNKQLTEYLTAKDISTSNCNEKFHLVDLIMEFAAIHGFKSGRDIENEVLHEHQIETLRQAEFLRQEEDDRNKRSRENTPTETQSTSTETLQRESADSSVSTNNYEHVTINLDANDGIHSPESNRIPDMVKKNLLKLLSLFSKLSNDLHASTVLVTLLLMT